MNKPRSLTRSLLLIAFIAIVGACSSPSDDDAAESSAHYNTLLSVSDVMALVLEPASDVLWDSAGWILSDAGYEELYPTTDEGWAYVRAQAAVVIEVGNILALPGRALDGDSWQIYSQGLSDAGVMAMQAAESRNHEDFFQAGAQIYSVCTACHQAYNPDINLRFANTEKEP